MHPAVPKLHALLVDLQGKDFALMAPGAITELRSTVAEGFKQATADLHTLLLWKEKDNPRWLWTAEKAPPPASDLIASYSLVDAERLENGLGQSARLQAAIALFGELKLTIHLFGDYHHVSGMGMQEKPRIVVVLELSSDFMFSLAEHYLKITAKVFPRSGIGISCEIVPNIGCIDCAANPTDARLAFAEIANAIRADAVEEHGDVSLVEPIDLRFSIEENAPLGHIEHVLNFMGRMFTNLTVVSTRQRT